MPQRIVDKLSQVMTDVVQAPQTSLATAGGTISAGAAEKLGYIGSLGSTVGIYIGACLSLLLIFVQVVRLRHDIEDRRVRIANNKFDRESAARSKEQHDALMRKKLELEIEMLSKASINKPVIEKGKNDV